MTVQHEQLAHGGWSQLSLAEQLANIGSEVGRMRRFRERGDERSIAAFWRALELVDLTIADPRWRLRLKEITRVREILCDAVLGSAADPSALEQLDRYFLAFGLLARRYR